MYYSPLDNNEEWRIERVPSGGGPSVVVRRDTDGHSPTVAHSALYYSTRAQATRGRWDWEVRRASPEDGPSQVLTRISGTRIAVSPLFINMALSPDGRRLAIPLTDGVASNSA
jgi:hypothetical protein